MSHRIFRSIFGAALLSAAIAAAPAQADITIGSNDGGNCYPFSCLPSDGGEWYQQIYNGSLFSGPVSISALSVFKSEGGAMDSATYTLNFYTTNAAVNALSDDRLANQGVFLGSFGAHAVGGEMPDVLSFSGPAFTFNPGSGNLLLDVSISAAAPIGEYNSFFQADYTGVDTSRGWGSGALGSTDTGGLVTLFTTTAAGAVPEPASWAMLIAGFGLVGATMRRRRVTVLTA